MKLRILSALIVVTLGLPHYSSAQVPRTLSYQGVLTDSLGNPGSDGPYTFTFRLYPTASAGSALWTESKALQVKRGLFFTALGDVVPLNTIAFDRQYWLSVQVSPDAEMTNRIALNAVGYSISAVKSDTARYALGAPAQPFVDSARIASTIADNAVTSSKIQDGTIQFPDIGQNGASAGQVMKWDGTAWTAKNDSVPPLGPWSSNGTNAFINANVGIGTNSPAFPLSFGDTTGDKISLYGASGDSYGFGIQPYLLQIHTAYAFSDIAFGSGKSESFNELMRIKGGGNVGIGTSSPERKLEVDGAIGVSDGAGNPYLLYGGIATEAQSRLINIGINDDEANRFGGSFVSGYQGGMFRVDARPGYPLFQFLARPASSIELAKEILTIQSDGNMGLGTTTPGFPLSFGASVGDKISLYGDAGAHYGIGVQPYLLQIHTDQPLSDIAFGTGQSASFAEVMRIKGNGNVGIGTTSPGQKLEVNGKVYANDGILFPDGRTQTIAGPIAYAFISKNGSVASGTSNVSCRWDPDAFRYEVTISGESYAVASYVTSITLLHDTGIDRGVRVSTDSVSGKLLIYIFNTVETTIQEGFQFVTYKP